MYYDISGRLQTGRYWFVGTVYKSMHETRSDQKRRTALGISNEITLDEAHNAKGAIDLIVITAFV